MADTSPSHWSKDFVEHLRTVHFALILVSSALIIAVTGTDSRRMNVALTQIEEIASFEGQWPTVPGRIYEQAMLDAKLPTSWQSGIEVKWPQSPNRKGSFFFAFEVPEDVVVKSQARQLIYPRLPAELNSLADFREFWNSLNQGLVVFLTRLPDESPCSAIPDFHPRQIKPRGEVICRVDKGRLDLAIWNGEAIWPASAKDANQYELEAGFKGLATLKIYPGAISSAKIGEGFGGNVNSIEVSLDSQRKIVDETYLKRLYFDDWNTGKKFDQAFAELSSLSSGLSTLPINDAVKRLQSEADSAEKDVSLFGFTIPIAALSRWGALLLLSTQLYFWLHLHELTRKIEPGADGLDVAWIGLYRSLAARVAMIVTCCLFPLAAAGLLGMKIVSISTYYRRTADSISICLVAASALLGVGAVSRLMTFWKQFSQEEAASDQSTEPAAASQKPNDQSQGQPAEAAPATLTEFE